MNKKRYMITVVVCLLVAAAGIMSAARTTQQKQKTETEIAALQEQLAELRNRSSRRRTNPDDPSSPAQTAGGGTNTLATLQDRGEAPNADSQWNRQPRESFEDRIARMKEEDPEGYAEMVKNRTERQQAMRYNLAKRTATFMDLDTSTMTEDERKNHDLLVEKMANIWTLTEQFQDPEQAPSRDAMRELFEAQREVRPLLEAERTVMFKQLGIDAGYQGNDAAAFAEQIQAIISATSIEMPRGGGETRGGQTGRRGN